MTDVTPYLPLAHVLGHDRDSCLIHAGEETNWATGPFLEFIKQLPGALKDQLLFVDIIVEVESNCIVGGIVTRSGLSKPYNGLLDELVKSYVTVGAHPDFTRGIIGEDNKEQCLFWRSNNKSFTEESDSAEFEVSPFDEKRVTDSLPKGETADSWLSRASTKPLDINWQFYTNKLSQLRESTESVGGDGDSRNKQREESANGVRVEDAPTSKIEHEKLILAIGIPITVPNIRDNKTGDLKVGALFLGLLVESQEKGLLTASDIASRCISLALRTYAIRTADLAKQAGFAQSHKLLMAIQRPLGTLTDAFAKVQAEAQEMQAILNDPEQGLFGTHKLLAPLYQEGRDIRISDFLTIKPKHDWQYSNSPSNVDQLQLAYCYALSSIFGVTNRLVTAQNPVAFVQMTYTALREVREKGTFDELVKVVLLVCFPNLTVTNIEETVHAISTHSDVDGGCRFQDALQALKRVAFSPFKSFSDKWYDAPIYIAAYGNKCKPDLLQKTERTMKTDRSPFPQYAILNFILGVKAQLKWAREKKDKKDGPTRSDWNPFDNISLRAGESDSSLDYILVLSDDCQFYDPNKDDESQLAACIEAAIRFGTHGRNLGSFLGIFQDLMRHGQDIVAWRDANVGAWVLLKTKHCPSSNKHVLAAFGRLKDQVGKPPTLDGPECECYFAIIQEKVNNSVQLRMLWTSRWDENAVSSTTATTPGQARQEVEYPASSGAEPPRAVQFSCSGQGSVPQSDLFYPVILLDHDRDNSLWKLKSWFPSLEVVTKDNEGNPNDFANPIEESVVLLHTSERSSQWQHKLSSLSNVKRVVVVSNQGRAEDKGIRGAKFEDCDVKPDQVPNDSNRQRTLLDHFKRPRCPK